jgi:hypothetical protein
MLASKGELFMSCHQAIVRQLHFGPQFSREGLLLPEAPPAIVSVYRHLLEARALLVPIFQGKDSLLILRQIRERSAQKIEASLRAVFAEADSTIPLDVLANYLAGAQIALVQWWLEKRQTHTPEDLAQTFHRLQRAAIRDAFGLTVGE